LVDKYLLSISENKGRKKANIGKICAECNIPKNLNIQEGILTCDQCGTCEKITIDSDKPAYKDQVPEVKSNTYKRSNHCSELLNQSQGKESTIIEQELLDEIVQGLYTIGIEDLTTITKSNIKEVLSNIGKSNKAEHAVYIINKINGIPVDTIPHELNEIVKIMFSMAETAWLIHKDPKRKNFMNTNYVFYKIFEMLEEYKLASKWSLISDEKLAEHDELWEKICNHWGEDRGWYFIPTI
jgi:predicted nucleic acid-binding OB-fold protein